MLSLQIDKIEKCCLSQPIDKQARLNLNNINYSIQPRVAYKNFIEKNFDDIYFTREENHWLDKLPRKGRKVPELNLDAVRELSLYSYRILYEIKSEALIEVLAVIHKRQHLEAEEILGDQ